jgi:hypothetical protein
VYPNSRARGGGMKAGLLPLERRHGGAFNRWRAREFDEPTIGRLVLEHRD